MSAKQDQLRGSPISIRLSGNDLDWARYLADIEGRTIGRWAANAIRDHIDQHRAAKLERHDEQAELRNAGKTRL